jgi:hypothetical protein
VIRKQQVNGSNPFGGSTPSTGQWNGKRQSTAVLPHRSYRFGAHARADVREVH